MTGRRPSFPWAWLLPLGLLALLAGQAPRLLAATANNLAARALLSEWDPRPGELPQCTRRLDASAAAPLLSRALAWDPANERALLNRGRAAWLIGDCAAARASWQQVLQAEPGDRIAALWLFWASGAEVKSLSDGALRRDLARFAYHSGTQALNDGPAGDGPAWLRLSLALAPARDMATRLAEYYEDAGQPEQAAVVWQDLAAALPEDEVDHWWALGQAAEARADWGQAAAAYRQGVDAARDPYELWLAYGAALGRMERRAEAEQAYRQAIVTRPGAVQPYLRLGELRAVQGDAEGALGWYRQALELRPGDAGIQKRIDALEKADN